MAEHFQRRRIRGIVSGQVEGPGSPSSAFSIEDGTVEITNVSNTRTSTGDELSPGEGTILSAGPNDTFIDASYIKAGVLDANLMRTGQLQTIASWNNKSYGSDEDAIESQQGFTGGYVYLDDWKTVSPDIVYVKFADWATYLATTTTGATNASTYFEVGDYVRVTGALFGQDGNPENSDGTNANVGIIDQEYGPIKYGSVVAIDTTGTGLTFSVEDTGKGTLDSGKIKRVQTFIPTISKAVRVSSISSGKLSEPNPAHVYEVIVTTVDNHDFVVGDYVELVSCGQVFSGVWYVVNTPEDNVFVFRHRFGIDADAALGSADLPALEAPAAIRVRKAYAVSSNGDLTAASINIRTARTQTGGEPIFQVLNDSIIIRKPDGTVLLSANTVGSSIDVGTVTADELTVGGDVDPNQIVRVGTNVSPSFRGIWAGNANPNSAEFSVDLDGNLVASNANITGTVRASSGQIGGFTIGATALTATNIVADSSGFVSVGSGNNVAVISGADANYRIWAGNSSPAAAKFVVDKSGNVTASGTLFASNANITGAVNATSGSFSGTVTASTGRIGGFTIGATALTATNIVADSSGYVSVGSGNNVAVMSGSDANYRFWVGNNNPASTAAQFKVEQDGSVTASDLTVTGGSITIGNFSLSTAGNITDDLIMTQTRIQNDTGVTLIDTNSNGETSTLFGGAALREIQTGVANGSFAEAPPNPYATINNTNKLPYWTFTDNNTSNITAALVADAGAASGKVLRFTIPNTTGPGKSAKITRYVPIPSSYSRSLSFYVEATFLNGTASTQANAQVVCEFYNSDKSNTVGASFASELYTFNDLATVVGVTAPNLYAITPVSLTATTAPANAAYLKISIIISTNTTQSAQRTVDLSEIRIANGTSEIILTDKDDPATYDPAYITVNQGTVTFIDGSGQNQLSFYDAIPGETGLELQANIGNVNLTAGGNFLFSGDTATFALAEDFELLGGGTTTLNGPTAVNVESTSGPVNITASSNITLDSNDGDVILAAGGGEIVVQDTLVSNGTNPRIVFRDKNGTNYSNIKSGGSAIVQVLSGTSSTTYGQLWAARIYPMNGTSASRYIDDDGTRTRFSGGIDVNASSTMTSITASSTISATTYTATSTTTALLASGGGDVTVTGADVTVPISGNGELTAIPNTTTATTNSARWVSTGTNTYALRRDSSTRRVKTNIVEADAAVLAAAKNLRAVHYEALEKDGEGNIVPSGKHTLGLIAEEIAEAGLGCAVTYDGEGLPDGYDERVIIAALLHRINDLEARLAELEARV